MIKHSTVLAYELKVKILCKKKESINENIVKKLKIVGMILGEIYRLNIS